MNRTTILAAVLLLAGLVLTVDAWAQRGDRMYDPSTVETVNGVVASIERVTPMQMQDCCGGQGVHLTLTTNDDETLSVHLGPAWYLDNQAVQIAAGDEITVRGSRITYAGAPALIAANVTRGDDTLMLRDDQGFPRWRGWRRGQRSQ